MHRMLIIISAILESGKATVLSVDEIRRLIYSIVLASSVTSASSGVNAVRLIRRFQ